MTIEQIKEIESVRQEPKDWNVIHFLRDGIYYRVHDWSAWLYTQYAHSVDDVKAKPVAKRMKDEYLDVMCGFPATSLSKFIDPNSNFQPINDDQFDLTIELPAELADIPFESLQQMKEEWKQSIPLQKSKKERREEKDAAEQMPRITRLSDVITRILAIPMERTSPMEAYEILSDLRRQVAEIY